MKEIEEKIRQICTYYSDDFAGSDVGTCGYSLVEGQFQKLFTLVYQLKKEWLEEEIKHLEGRKKNEDRLIEELDHNNVVPATYDYGYNSAISDLISHYKEKLGELEK